LNEEASYSILVDNLWKLLIQSGDAIAGGNRCKPDKLIAARIHPNRRNWPVAASSGRPFLISFFGSRIFSFRLPSSPSLVTAHLHASTQGYHCNHHTQPSPGFDQSQSQLIAHPTDNMSASPTPSGGADAKPADQIHFRFCREW
jgi:hypothetical protein